MGVKTHQRVGGVLLGILTEQLFAAKGSRVSATTRNDKHVIVDLEYASASFGLHAMRNRRHCDLDVGRGIAARVHVESGRCRARRGLGEGRSGRDEEPQSEECPTPG